MNVFISHSASERELAQKLIAALKEAGLNVFYMYSDIYPGENWAEKLAVALREADAMLVLITPYSEISPNVSYELSYAQLGASGASFGVFQGDTNVSHTARATLSTISSRTSPCAAWPHQSRTSVFSSRDSVRPCSASCRVAVDAAIEPSAESSAATWP